MFIILADFQTSCVMAKINVPKSTLLIVVLLAVVFLAYKFYEGHSAKKELKHKSSPPASSSLYKHGRKQSSIVVSSRSTNKGSNATSIGKVVERKVHKPTKPVIKKFNLLFRKKGNVFYREVVPNGKPKHDILLMHGKKFNSSTWVKLKTMDILVSAGYRVIAMDLPGSGNSHFKLNNRSDKNLEKFLGEFIKKASVVSPVIVSPSASGRFSLPYIVGKNKVSGFVPIAAVASDRFPLKSFKYFKAPTLIIRGSKDMSLGKTSMDTLHQAIPHSKTEIIQGAGHACYIHKPDEFHKVLLKFLNGIFKEKSARS